MLRRARWLGQPGLFLLLVLFGLILHRKALTVFFSLDDLLFLERVDGLVAWASEYPLRRLLSVRLFFTAAWRLFGDRAELYHVFIIVLHGACGWLVALLGRRLGLREGPAALAGLLLVASPVAFTSLHWISGVQEVFFAFFALITALCLTRDGLAWSIGALISYLLLMLSKEAGFLLLPVLPFLLPTSRRRRLWLAGIGLLAGILLLFAGGAVQERPYGHPYETVYGVNVFWNLLTYLAWLARPWVAFPDQVPEFQPALWRWGLLLPALLALLAWRRRDWAPQMGRAALLFLLLLMPVLPLVRHSYFYYLYVPLIPLWLLAAAGLGRLPQRLRLVTVIAPLLLVALTYWQADQRRTARIGGNLLADPMLRYGQMVGTAVTDLRAAPGERQGDAIILTPFIGQAVDLAKGLRAPEGARHVRFLPIEKALHGGLDLRLFFPGFESVRFVPDLDGSVDVDWQEGELYWTWGQARLGYLGRGTRGRVELSRVFFGQRDFARARREIELLLSLRPNDPDRLYDLGVISLAEGKGAGVQEVRQRLEELAGAEEPPGRASRALRDYLRMLRESGAPDG